MRKVSDEMVAELAKAFHDGPLMADDHEFVTDSGQGRWCLQVAEFFIERLAALESVSSIHEAEPDWGDAGTVGNLIAQLRTFAPETPIHGAFHADAGDGRKARIRGLTLSRERVDGRLIDTGNVLVPYSIVAWSAPDERPAPISKGVTVSREFYDHLVRMTGYHIVRPPTPDHEFVNVCNGDLRRLDDFMSEASSHTAGELEAGGEVEIEPVQKMHELVEQAFRDGVAYATNCEVTDVDLAWSQSRVRAALVQETAKIEHVEGDVYNPSSQPGSGE